MSNTNIVQRIQSLICSLESGEIAIREFAEKFEALYPALEDMDFSKIKDAQMAVVGFEIDGDMDADGFGDHEQMVADTVRWARGWLESVRDRWGTK